jgi:uncharacterized membrane protein
MRTAAGRGPARTLSLPASLDVPLMAVAVMIAAYAALFSWLSVRRYEAFWTARYDLGNMAQAAWSVAHGGLFVNTDGSGEQVSRLASHVDPILGLFAPIFWVTGSPVPMLVLQALIVAVGALPVFWLARRWLGDDRLAVAAAAVWLLYPPLQWAVVTEFHPVTLAAPLLAFCVWAAEEERWWWLAGFAVAALLCKENVGLALVVLGVWICVRRRRPLPGAVLSVLSAAWVAVAVWVIIPHYRGSESAFVDRYGELGGSTGEIARTLITRPWEAVEQIATYHRLTYVLALLVPLLFLPLLAPLLTAAALPDLLLNLLADWWPQYSIEFQYTAVIAPFLVLGAVLGLARLRTWRRPGWLAAAAGRSGLVAAGMVVWLAGCTAVQGPLPWFGEVSVASDSRLIQYRVGPHAAALRRAVDRVPPGAVVSAGNHLGSHLSARERILTFPQIQDAEWVVVDRTRPTIGFDVQPATFRARVAELLARPDFALVSEEDGVLVLRRRAPASTGAP